ncbi:MAG TPA: glycosyltransferase family 87 protein [Allosphingosinicella sp.]|jgi:hypothetical protein
MSAPIPQEQFAAALAPTPAASSLAVRLWPAMWILAALIATQILARDLALTRWSGDGSIADVAQWGRDFVNVYTSGSLTLNGGLDILYNVDAYRAFQLGLFESGMKYHNYSYPPVSLLYTWLFALVPYPVALLSWLGGTGALFVLAARPYLREAGLPIWLAVLAPASLINIWAGHYGFLIGALWLGAWHVLPRRPVLAGVLIGLMVVKPHLAILAPLVLARRREWVAIAAAGVTAGGLIALSVALFGADLWITYLTETARLQAAMVDDTESFFIMMMPTVTPSMALLGMKVGAGMAVQALVGIAAVGLLLWKLPKDSGQAGFAAAAATFLVLPYAFSYDMTVVGLGALILFHKAVTQRRPGSFQLLLMLAALAPMSILYMNSYGVPLTPLLIGMQLLVALKLWRGEGPDEQQPLRPVLC